MGLLSLMLHPDSCSLPEFDETEHHGHSILPACASDMAKVGKLSRHGVRIVCDSIAAAVAIMSHVSSQKLPSDHIISHIIEVL